ncbi:hypothetical protein [Streptomyces sp. NPDC005096]|uniref:hypothetical protein n=1 Tax=Streptomyces sp. NPDC005096 TaxID=3154559 RepID=UPI0033A91A40
MAGKTVASSFRVARGGPTTFQDESSLTVNVTIITQSQEQSQEQSQSQTVTVKCPSDHDKRAAA